MTQTDSRPLILALDFGGTKHSAALVDRDDIAARQWLAHDRVYSPPGADALYDRTAMVRMARGLLDRVPGRLTAIGVSFGGPVDSPTGTVRLSHHVPGWEDTPLAPQLQAEFGAPAAVENDGNIGALGEWRLGAGQGCASVLYVTVSTGIGGGWVLNGRIWNGADGMAGEIGHITVRPGGLPCVCGKRGCLEAEACGPAIALKMRSRLGPAAAENVTGQFVAQAALGGDGMAQEVMDEAARLLGTGLGTAINLMDPECIVMGGGVTKSGDRYWRIVRETAREQALPQMRVDIRPAALGDDAPLWGAVALAESRL